MFQEGPESPVVRYFGRILDDTQRVARGSIHYVKPMTDAKLLIPGRHIQLLDSIGKGTIDTISVVRSHSQTFPNYRTREGLHCNGVNSRFGVYWN